MYRTTFILLLAFIGLCWARDVIVNLNDPKLVVSPSVLRRNICGGVYSLAAGSDSVSLTFNGTRVGVNFIVHAQGTPVEITVDRTKVVLDTRQTQTADDCVKYLWYSDSLSPGQHTITLQPPSNRPPPRVDILNFIYTPLTSRSSTPKLGVVVGATVGGIAALLLALVGILLFWRKRKRSKSVMTPVPNADPTLQTPMFSPVEHSWPISPPPHGPNIESPMPMLYAPQQAYGMNPDPTGKSPRVLHTVATPMQPTPPPMYGGRPFSPGSAVSDEFHRSDALSDRGFGRY